MTRVVLGIERLAGDARAMVRGRRIGLVAHPASTTAKLEHARSALQRAGARVEALFGPEHGFLGQAQDMEAVPKPGEVLDGPREFSLYGSDEASLTPNPESLAGLDALVVDLFDVGSRYYTFVWTAVLCLRACHRDGVQLILADRPNPLGGLAVEGAPQQPGYLSFVGLRPLSNRHGMTAGEILSMAAAEERLEPSLRVVEMEGWRRSMHFGDTGLPWVMPSPNMPTCDTALVYPGLCLIEATEASEGRGTTRPFELVGAPGIDGARLAARLEAMALPGARFRPAAFRPGFQKHRGVDCGGVQIHVVDRERFLPYRTGVAVLLALQRESGDRFAWRERPYEFVSDRPAIDLLTGGEAVRLGVESGAALEDIAATWEEGEREFREYRRRFLLY